MYQKLRQNVAVASDQIKLSQPIRGLLTIFQHSIRIVLLDEFCYGAKLSPYVKGII